MSMTESESPRHSRIQTAALLARAAARMTPRMVSNRIGRILRGQLAHRFPRAFDRRIEAATRGVPPLRGLGAEERSAVESVAFFYTFAHMERRDDLARGIVTLFGRAIDFGDPGGIGWSATLPEEGDHQLWRMKLNHMGFVAALLLSPDERHRDAALAMLRSFAPHTHDWARPGVFESTWFPYSVSHRVLALTSVLLLARDSLSPEAAREVESFLRFNVGFLVRNVEHDTYNNHVERNLAALCFYYGHATEVPAWVAQMLDREVRTIVEATVLPDGLQIERSAMYQGLTVMALRIFASTPFLSQATRALASARGENAARAWRSLSHPDGEIALFNDSWFGETPQPGSVVAAPPADGLTVLPDGGFARLAQGDDVLIFDAGPIGPAWNPGHGHADFLSLELSLAGRRLLVDPGTSVYSAGPRRQRERSLAAHNGPHYEGIEPVEFEGAFKVGRLVAAHLLDPGPLDRLPFPAVGGVLDMAGAGRVARGVVMVPGDGFLIEDQWYGANGSPLLRFLVPDNWALTRTEDHAFLAESGGVRVSIAVMAGTIASVAPAQWCRRYMKPEPANAILVRPSRTDGLTSSTIWIGRATRAPAGLPDALREALLEAAHIERVAKK
jgi:hypothetical protein